MDFYFRDLKEEKQREFISKNLAEILCEQRKKDKISMEEFLKRYFDYNIYTKKTGSLSLSQLKRYEKEFKNKIIKFRNDEIHHKDIAYKEGATKDGLYSIMDKVIKTGSKIAIRISEKI